MPLDKIQGIDPLQKIQRNFDEIETSLLTSKLSTVVIVVGTETGDAVIAALQLKDNDGEDLAVRGSLFAYLSDDANGDSIAVTAPDGNIAISTDGLLIPVVANKAFNLVSEADGVIDLLVTESGTDTWYLIVVLPDGSLVASDAITFAA